ncbi:NUDIX domain-containing protein [Oceanicola sp. S124]|uniref:NUDIX domain-containing protein n=1 Tax=Oceanicola sp. S124 TaxID=1042378 RepID=UPI00058F0634|nr:NUDIX domain-containing protein [Oceanicola sp. S124]
MTLFIYGPLCIPVMMQIVAGCRPVEEPARLEGYRVAPRQPDGVPLLVQAPGATAEGLLLRDVSEEIADRIAHYADAHGLEPVSMLVEGPAGPLRALAFRGEPGQWPVAAGNWSAESWAAAGGEEACHAAHEVMKLRGRYAGEALRFRLNQIRARAAARVTALHETVPHVLGRGPSDPWVEEIGQRDDHAGWFFTRTYDLRHQSFAGRPSPQIRREVLLAPDAAILLPYDPLRDRVLLVEQFRMGPYARGEALPWMLEPVAGRVDPGETAAQCARREAREEAGLDLHDLLPVAKCYPTPGCSTEFYHCFVGLCDLPETAPGRGGLAEEDEDIRTHVLPFDRAMEMLSSGEARNAPLILSLLWLASKRSELRGAA